LTRPSPALLCPAAPPDWYNSPNPAAPRAERCPTVPFRVPFVPFGVPAVPFRVPFGPYNQPFIPLNAIPLVKYRCPNRKMISTGRVTTTVPAISRSHVVVYCVWNTWSPT